MQRRQENRMKNGPKLPKNHDLQETDVLCNKHIPLSLAHSRRNAVRHVNIIHNVHSVTKRLGTRQITVQKLNRRWKHGLESFSCQKKSRHRNLNHS